MTSTSTPGYEVAAALVSAFSDNPAWSAAPLVGNTGGLLFPSWSPRVDADDYRVYSNHAELPPIPAVLTALPRILIDVNWRMHQYEQEQVGTLHGPVSVWLHIVVPRDREEYGETLTAAAMVLMQSTQLSSARIIAGELTPTSDITRDQLTQFNNAWEFLVGYRTASVGVLL